MVPAFYQKYAVFQLKLSSWVKSDPPILTGSKRPNWSQNFIKLGLPQAEWIHYLATWPQGCHDISLVHIPLRRPKRLIFLGQGPVQGPREEVQGPCARATNLVNRNGCKGHLDKCKGHNQRCKGLCCVQGPHLWPIYLFTNDKQYNLVQGPQLEVQRPLKCARASSLANLPNY